MALIRQHVIDPVICIRCNTCEDTCPSNAITHNDMNYVVDPDICQSNLNRQCLGPCPTGAIDSWVLTSRPWSVDEQMEWVDLPSDDEDAGVSDGAVTEHGREPEEVAELRRVATEGTGGPAKAPVSASTPKVHVYTRAEPALAKVTGNLRLTDENASADIRHIVLDFGKQVFPVLEGQSIGIIPPGEDEQGRPHRLRLYSIANPRDGERPKHNNISLTVKRVEYEENGALNKGFGSNYMCDLKSGDEVQVVGPFGTTFLMPDDPDARIIMICTGTGSAPFRAMTEHRRRLKDYGRGKLLLFFGARKPSELPYFGPLMRLPRALIDVEFAFSRLPDCPKEYVQDRLRKRSDEVAELLKDESTYVYLCGRKDMESGCNEAFTEICRASGMDWQSIKATMRESGRFHVETY